MTDIFNDWNEQLDREILVHTELLDCVQSLPPALAEGDVKKITERIESQRRLTAKVQAVRSRRQQLRQRSKREFGCDTVGRIIPHAPLDQQPKIEERRDRLTNILNHLKRQQELAQHLMRSHLGFLNDVLSMVGGNNRDGAYGRQGKETMQSTGGNLLNIRG